MAKEVSTWSGLAVVLLALCGTTTESQGPFDLGQTREYFRKMQDGPYIYLQSPRTGMGVGTVYTIVDKTTWFLKRPDECFSQAALEKAKADTLSPPQFGSLTSKTGWEVGLKIASTGPITEDVQAEMKRKGVVATVITIPKLQRHLITIPEFRAAIRSEMDLSCRSELTRQKPDRWVILETLSTDQFSIAFEGSSGTDVSLSVGILKVLFPRVKFGSEKEYKGTLAISGEPHVVAFKAIKVGDAIKFSSGTHQEIIDPMLYYQVVDKP